MYVEEGHAMIALLCLCSVILIMFRCCSIIIIFVFRAVIVLSRLQACGMHVLKPFRVHPPVPVVLADLHPRFVFSCVAAHIMAVEPTRSPSKEAEILDTEEPEVEPSQTSSSGSDAHNAAAAENAKEKKKKGNAEKRKADKVLTMPQSSSVSDLQISLQEAKSKRDAAKKEAKVETNKVKLARTRVERVKAKARVLSNNDLYEVYILRMQEEAKKNAANK
jgi:hypothetical protein